MDTREDKVERLFQAMIKEGWTQIPAQLREAAYKRAAAAALYDVVALATDYDRSHPVVAAANAECKTADLRWNGLVAKLVRSVNWFTHLRRILVESDERFDLEVDFLDPWYFLESADTDYEVKLRAARAAEDYGVRIVDPN